MPSRDSVGLERKIEHRLFLLSVWSKGIAGLLETIGGVILLLIPQSGLNAFVIFLTAPELAEDPSDRVATLLQHRSRTWSRYETFRQQLSNCSWPYQSFPSRRAVRRSALVIFSVALVLGRFHRLPNLSFSLHSLALANCTEYCRSDRRLSDLA
jgi:hypothetical protein